MFLKFIKLSWLGPWFVMFIFIVIYQHNLIIKRSYEKQRLYKIRIALETERSELYRKLLQKHCPEIVAAQVEQSWGMKPLQPSQVQTMTSMPLELDFIGTMSTQAILKKLGLDDEVIMQGRRS